MGPLERTYLTTVVDTVEVSQKGCTVIGQVLSSGRGKCHDMLAAVELTQRRDLRRKYLEHALDEAQHARMFKNRALDLVCFT